MEEAFAWLEGYDYAVCKSVDICKDCKRPHVVEYHCSNKYKECFTSDT